jgi:tRNA/rRNA methyltransferase
MRIHFILSHPAVPENIGFACRAMKTMGFDHLILVNPVDHLDQKTLKTAYGSHDLLESARICSNLSEAIEGMDLVVGTTAKNRVSRHDYYAPTELGQVLESKVEVVNNVALVFGSEKNGLSNQEVELCDLLTTVPLHTKHPSLNLAQAVMIYAYELSQTDLTQRTTGATNDTREHQKQLKSRAVELLDYLEVSKQHSLYQRLKDRLMSASAEDTSLLLSLSRFLKRKFDN